jgi:uncharacterized protein YwgA
MNDMDEKERALLILKKKFNFNLSEFNDRVDIQKTVFLLNKLKFPGLLNYKTFSWYIYGPYCTELTKDVFKLYEKDNVTELVNNIKINTDEEQILNEFKVLRESLKIDDNLPKYTAIELFSSIIYFYNDTKDIDATKENIKKYKPYLSDPILLNDAIKVLQNKKLI